MIKNSQFARNVLLRSVVSRQPSGEFNYGCNPTMAIGNSDSHHHPSAVAVALTRTGGTDDANFKRTRCRGTKEYRRKRNLGGVVAGDHCRRLRHRCRRTDIAGPRIWSWLRFGVAMV